MKADVYVHHSGFGRAGGASLGAEGLAATVLAPGITITPVSPEAAQSLAGRRVPLRPFVHVGKR